MQIRIIDGICLNQHCKRKETEYLYRQRSANKALGRAGGFFIHVYRIAFKMRPTTMSNNRADIIPATVSRQHFLYETRKFNRVLWFSYQDKQQEQQQQSREGLFSRYMHMGVCVYIYIFDLYEYVCSSMNITKLTSK